MTKNNKTIAQIVCTWPPYKGGIGNSAHTIEQLLKEEYQIQTYTPYNLKPWFQYGHGAFLPQLLKKLKKYDYIYLHYPFFGTAEIVWLFKLLHPQKKLIIHYHMDVINYSFLTRILSLPSISIRKSLFKKADIIITSSLDYIKHSDIKNIYHKYPNKFREIPFGLDINLYKPPFIIQKEDNKLIKKTKEIVKEVNKYLKGNRFQIIFIGGLDKAHYFKGLEVLLHSLAILPKHNWHLKIIGDGDLKEKYQNLSTELMINNRVEFLGGIANTKQLIKEIQSSDVLVLPSINKNEAFGLVLIEALACGVPVIASRLPGVRSVFTHYQQGLLVEVNDVKDLKDKIQLLMEDKEMQKLMSQAARELAIEKYDLNIMKNKLKEIFT